MINSFNDFFDSVAMFNEIAGNLVQQENMNRAMAALANQFSRVEEEAQEGVEGADKHDLEAVLDAAVDSLVTAFGAMQMLNANFPDLNISGAINLICQNNLSKFTRDMTEEQADENIAFYKGKGEAVRVDTVEHNEGTFGVIRRRSDNKIMKPIHYVPVSLKECL